MKKPYHKNIAAAVIIAATMPATCAAADYQQLARDLCANAPELKVLAAEQQSQLFAAKAENILENPEVEFERLWNASGVDNKWNLSVSQSFDWPGLYRARSKAAEAMTVAAEAELYARQHSLQYEVENTLLELGATNRSIAILDTLSTNLSRLEQAYQKAWDNGEVTILDLNKARLEAVKAKTQLGEEHSRRNRLMAELASLTGADEATLAPFANLCEFPVYELPDYEKLMEAIPTHPSVVALQLQAVASQYREQAAKLERAPGFSLGYVHAFEEQSHFNGFTLGISLPVYSRKNSVQAAKLETLAQQFGAEARKQQLAAQIEAEYANAGRLKQLLSAYGEVIENTDNFRLLRRALEGGEMSLLTYIQEVNYYLDSYYEYRNLQSDYYKSLLTLRSMLP